jgi:hypothetical protein
MTASVMYGNIESPTVLDRHHSQSGLVGDSAEDFGRCGDLSLFHSMAFHDHLIPCTAWGRGGCSLGSTWSSQSSWPRRTVTSCVRIARRAFREWMARERRAGKYTGGECRRVPPTRSLEGRVSSNAV